MMVEEPADGFERGLNEGEGFFKFQGVGFVKGHEWNVPELCTELGFSSFFLLLLPAYEKTIFLEVKTTMNRHPFSKA
jgi:hypothetical protein